MKRAVYTCRVFNGKRHRFRNQCKQMEEFILKIRIVWIATFAAAMLSWTSTTVHAQEPQALIPGLNVERTLGPKENHVYTITLQEGTAIIGEADQHGIDLVIDIFGPDAKLIRTVDSSDGTEGLEPIDLTAFKTGLYRLVIHTNVEKADPGKYLIKIDRILTVDENGQRMAEKNYPLPLQSLWRSYLTDPNAVKTFIANRKGKGPIIEPVPGDSKNVSVIYLYYGDENTELVRTSGGPHAAVGGILMRRFMRTPLFFAEETVPNDARYRYNFAAIEKRFVGPAGSVQIRDDVFPVDALNPETFGGLSVLTMPKAPAQPYVVKKGSEPHGKLTTTTLKSLALKGDRPLTIYTPPGYDGTKACDLLIVFDGVTYGEGPDSFVPTPTILDNLIAAKKINPTVSVLVPNIAGQRIRDLGGYPPFADFIANELVPWARKTYLIVSGPGHVVVAGSSRGALCASYCAFRHPETIGNVLSQSGSYWVTKETENSPPYPLTEDTGDLIRDLRDSKRLPIKFYIEIGRFDDSGRMLATNRELRDLLLIKGYEVTYKEFDSGHDFIWWRGSLADGLIALIGRRGD